MRGYFASVMFSDYSPLGVTDELIEGEPQTGGFDLTVVGKINY
jgi:hypothetical protein